MSRAPAAHRDIPTGPIVLVAPAMAIGSGYYRPLAEEFRSRGWEAQVLGRRGFEKDLPRASRHQDWSYQDEIDDIADAVAAARAEHPGRRVLLLGHSLGGQLAVGHALNRPPTDGLVTVGGSLPHHRHFPLLGLHVVVMAALAVPLSTTVFGYLPEPLFGAPGARTLMREWARMALVGDPPFAEPGPIATPSLVISLGGDGLSPRRGVDELSRRFFRPGCVTRWHYRDTDVPVGGSNDHIAWVRSPGPVVDRVVSWWSTTDLAAHPAGHEARGDRPS